jgi:hypothetical protein
MHPRYRGRLGEYLKEIDERRLERYKERPWELRTRSQNSNILFVFGFTGVATLLLVLVFWLV